jgi:hypothetical protein
VVLRAAMQDTSTANTSPTSRTFCATSKNESHKAARVNAKRDGSRNSCDKKEKTVNTFMKKVYIIKDQAQKG